jgi:beta-1,4-mannosyltransferase
VTASLRVLAWPAFANRGNPYHAQLYTALAGLGVEVREYSPGALAGDDWDVLHLHWPEFLLGRRPARATAAFVARVVRAKRAGRRVVWTVHNLAPHDGEWRGHALYRLTSHLTDGVIAHSDASLAAARARHRALRRRPATVVPHGHYRDVYPSTGDRDDARRSLGLEPHHRAVLCFGAIRPYKRVDHLLDTFARTPGDDLRLLVAGQPTPELRPLIELLAALDPRVQLHLDFVPDDDVARWFTAADLVVLPHDSSVLDSGVALLGLSFDRPVLGPDVASQRDLRAMVGAEWVHTYESLEPSALLAAVAAAHGRDPHAPLDHLDWSRLATRTADFYRAITGAAPHGTQLVFSSDGRIVATEHKPRGGGTGLMRLGRRASGRPHGPVP